MVVLQDENKTGDRSIFKEEERFEALFEIRCVADLFVEMGHEIG